MASGYIERTKINGVEYSKVPSQTQLLNDFENKLSNVIQMLENEGPVLSTWIRFQLGTSGNPVYFDSSSTNPKKNLIAQLYIKKNGADVANSFSLTVQYDPFNMGQETADIVEQLDEYVATAMAVDWTTPTDTLSGYLQYGYNSVSDSSLVSPKYKFIITNATSNVKFESGLSTYTFEGTSYIASDCDNVQEFSAINDWKLMDIIEWVLYYWYGDPENKPNHTGDAAPHPSAANFKYKIDIPDEIYNDSELHVDVPAMSGMTPWQYCEQVLYDHPLTQSEKDSGKYDLTTLTYAERPRYVMYLDDSTNTIHVSHMIPKDSDNKQIYEKNVVDLSIKYRFHWGLQRQNLIIGWKPTADTRMYYIKKMRVARANKDLQEKIQNGETGEVIDKAKETYTTTNNDLIEMYQAQLTTIGIPGTPPITTEFTIVPTILETRSRTAGIYYLTQCEDNITSTGIYTSTFSLFRARGLDDKPIELEKSIPEEDTKQPTTSATSTAVNTDGSGGSFSSGGNGSFGGGGGRWWSVDRR